jgi:XTP/dITP diphosphohydrolase
MHQVVLASGNPGKLREFSALFAPLGVSLIAQRELGISDAEEPHPTFVENALAKARHASRESRLPALADDSGICVDALQGRPGVRSARFANPQPGLAQDDANNARLMIELEGVADRTARYVCVLVLVRCWDDPRPLIVEADWVGLVIDRPRGQGGFGYDPYFLPTGLGQTAAELAAEDKNRLSHRGRAARALIDRLPGWAGSAGAG